MCFVTIYKFRLAMKKITMFLLLTALLVSFHWLDAQPGSLNNGLIAHYLFNQELTDISGNGNHGTSRGGLQYAEDRFGNQCGALQFNGTDSYVLVPSSTSLESPSNQLSVRT